MVKIRPFVPLLGLAIAVPALAETPAPGSGPRTLEVFPQGVERCYRASFGAAERKARAGQVLSEFVLYRLLRPNPRLEEAERSAEELMAADRAPEAANGIDVLARLDDGKGYYGQSLTCRDSESGIFCGVECDGGGFTLSREGAALRLDLGADGGGVSLNLSCGEPDEEGAGHWLTAREAGGTIVLPPQPLEACVAADAQARPAFAADPVPLRERIAASGWRCLKRVYDKAHLRKHPRQKVTAMALAIKGPARVESDEYGWKTTHLTATLSLRTRGGGQASKGVDCVSDRYQFRCGEEGDAFRLRRRDATTALLLPGAYAPGEGEAPPAALLGLAIGTDDAIFRLAATSEPECRIE
jgi:hypothetical protein